MEQHDEARIKAHEVLKARRLKPEEFGQGTTLREVYGDTVARELLAMACVSVNAIPGTEDNTSPIYGRIFRSAADLAQLTADELTTLFTTWEMVQHKYGPYEGSIQSDEEANAWIKRLAEGGSAFPLAQLSWHQLVELTVMLSERAYCLSVLLGSLRESWPSSLGSATCESWGIGTGYFGERRANELMGGSGPDFDPGPSDAPLEPVMRLPSDEAITIEDAARMAQALHKRHDE